MKRKSMFILAVICMTIANSAFGQSETAYQSSEISFAGSTTNIEQVEITYPDSIAYYKYKSPFVAWALSFFVLPGIGQMYNGDWITGCLFLGGAVASWALFSYGAWSLTDYKHSPTALATSGVIIGCLGILGCWIGSWATAPNKARRLNAEHGLLSWQIGKKSNLALSPDIKLYNNILPTQNTASTFGMKVSINF